MDGAESAPDERPNERRDAMSPTRRVRCDESDATSPMRRVRCEAHKTHASTARTARHGTNTQRFARVASHGSKNENATQAEGIRTEPWGTSLSLPRNRWVPTTAATEDRPGRSMAGRFLPETARIFRRRPALTQPRNDGSEQSKDDDNGGDTRCRSPLCPASPPPATTEAGPPVAGTQNPCWWLRSLHGTGRRC